jgi:hypothetical protein
MSTPNARGRSANVDQGRGIGKGIGLKARWIPSLIFTCLCLGFLFYAYTGPDLNDDRRKLLNGVFALNAGFATFFLGGSAVLRLTGGVGRLRTVFNATAGIAVFSLCLIYRPLFPGDSDASLRDSHNHPFLSLANKTELRVIDLQDRIEDNRQYLETIQYPASRVKLKTSYELGERMVAISDKELNPRRVYIKYQYAANAYLMTAAAYHYERSMDFKAYADRAVELCEKDLSILDEAHRADQNGHDSSFLLDWVHQDEGEDRVRYFLTMALALRSWFGTRPNEAAAANDIWMSISTEYRHEYPASDTKQLAECKCIKEDVK